MADQYAATSISTLARRPITPEFVEGSLRDGATTPEPVESLSRTQDVITMERLSKKLKQSASLDESNSIWTQENDGGLFEY
jgi:hypothetical protein